MGIYTGNAAAQRLRCSGEVSAAYLDSQQVWPDTDAAADWLWQSDGTAVTLLLYRGDSRFLTIPETLNGLTVTALAPTACNYSAVKAVTLPASILLLQ